MRNETRLVYNALLSQIARLNGVAEVGKQFNVAPTIQQRLESKMQESSDFLGKINMTPVVEAQGAKLGLGVSGPVASRTNTGQRRPPNARRVHAGQQGLPVRADQLRHAH